MAARAGGNGKLRITTSKREKETTIEGCQMRLFSVVRNYLIFCGRNLERLSFPLLRGYPRIT
jgi:hypothetical protein